MSIGEKAKTDVLGEKVDGHTYGKLVSLTSNQTHANENKLPFF